MTVFRFQKNNLVHHFQNPGFTHPLLPIDLCFQSLINLSPQLFISFSFLKRYFSYLLLDQREGRKKGKERNIDQLPFPHAPSGDCTCNPSMYPDHRDLSLWGAMPSQHSPTGQGSPRVFLTASLSYFSARNTSSFLSSSPPASSNCLFLPDYWGSVEYDSSELPQAPSASVQRHLQLLMMSLCQSQTLFIPGLQEAVVKNVASATRVTGFEPQSCLPVCELTSLFLSVPIHKVEWWKGPGLWGRNELRCH